MNCLLYEYQTNFKLMEIHRKWFPDILNDNDEVYFAHLEGIISSVDELSHLQITRLKDTYHFRIAPSIPKYTEIILQEILKFHTLYGIKLDLSKSIKSSSTIVFTIKL
jgi:hypothetical protein